MEHKYKKILYSILVDERNIGCFIDDADECKTTITAETGKKTEITSTTVIADMTNQLGKYCCEFVRCLWEAEKNMLLLKFEGKKESDVNANLNRLKNRGRGKGLEIEIINISAEDYLELADRTPNSTFQR